MDAAMTVQKPAQCMNFETLRSLVHQWSVWGAVAADGADFERSSVEQ